MGHKTHLLHIKACHLVQFIQFYLKIKILMHIYETELWTEHTNIYDILRSIYTCQYTYINPNVLDPDQKLKART